MTCRYLPHLTCRHFPRQVYLVPDHRALLLIAALLFGFFCNGAFPLCLEMGVETTYPVEETISTTLMFVIGE